ncbi:ParA family protein [uncultured Hyphomonas sp.]|uniref:ParA family protein n=1 Tax=uncultured Hyphomonas sp. TaxID=225298 RepID=UPI00260B35B8|nr:ParA family protein [uncultured Hyphomonas sp.]
MATKSWRGRRVVSISNLKGGVGKSTTTMMLADALSLKHNARVVVVDLDPQANVSQMLLSYRGLQTARNTGITLTDWVESLSQSSQTEFFTYASPGVSGLHELNPKSLPQYAKDSGELSLVPATPELRFAELEFDHNSFQTGNPAAPTARMIDCLDRGVKSFKGSVDLVLFDCPPAFSTLAQAALSISDAIISPTLEEPLGAWSLKAFRDFGLDKTLRVWDPERHRVLFTRVSRKGALDERREVRNNIVQAGFHVLPVAVKDSSYAHRWVQKPAPESRKRYASKYGPVRRSVTELGDEVAVFLGKLSVRGELKNGQ